MYSTRIFSIDVTRRDNWGGGGAAYSYIRVLPDGFLLKAIVFTVCKNEYEYTTPSPQLSRLVVALIFELPMVKREQDLHDS